MRRRFSYANVAATLALVFSMSGGALAAKHYLINSTKQINPKVLKALKGKTGAAGLPGAAGAAGKEGSQGKEGPAGSAVAFAHILGKTSPSSPLDAANSKNISAASQATKAPGLFCITTTVPIKNPAGSGDFASGNTVLVTANFTLVPLAVTLGDCPAGTTVLAETTQAGTVEPEDFWISFN